MLIGLVGPGTVEIKISGLLKLEKLMHHVRCLYEFTNPEIAINPLDF